MTETLKKLPENEMWEERTEKALERKDRMLSFGQNACGLLVTTKHGLFAVDPEDGFVSADLLDKGVYNEGEYLLAKSFVSKNSDVLIVGAHIGTHAVRLAKDCHRLIAIEANPHTFSYLQANLLLNQCSNTTAYRIAASDKVEKIRFLANRDNSGGSKRMPLKVHPAYIYDNPDIVEIDAMPLDTLIDSKIFDLVLVDIEGSEYFALKGMQQILAASKVLSVEFIPHHIKYVGGVDAEEFIGAILPHFEWMYIPAHNRIIPKQEIRENVKAIYRVGEAHDGLFFLKDPLPDWLQRRRAITG